MHWHARRDGLVTTFADEDMLIYDQADHSLHRLTPLAALAWQRLDGKTADETILAAGRATIDPSIDAVSIELAIAGLAEAGLLEEQPNPVPRQSRRTWLRRAAKTSAVIPAVVSVTVPMAAQAQSTDCAPGDFPTIDQCEAALEGFDPGGDPSCSVTVAPHCVKLTFGPCYRITYTVTCP